MARAYVRLDPAYYERKLEQGYPLGAIAALVGCFCMGESQTSRGRFRDHAVLRALLGKEGGRWVGYLIERGDLIVELSGRIYIDGWEEWQEGDWQVKERMQRVRSRKRVDGSEPTVTPVTAATVTDRPSGAGRGGDKAGRTNRYTTDALKAFHHVTGRQPDDTDKKWLADLCRDFTREVVIQQLYDDPTPLERGILGRISKLLRHGKKAAA